MQNHTAVRSTHVARVKSLGPASQRDHSQSEDPQRKRGFSLHNLLDLSPDEKLQSIGNSSVAGSSFNLAPKPRDKLSLTHPILGQRLRPSV
jgi:hypothetical protein